MSAIIGSILSSMLAGGATGLLGNFINKFFDYKRRDQAHRHELEMLKAEREITKLEIEGRERVAEIQSESAEAVASFQAMEASFEHDQAQYSERVDKLTERQSGWLVFVDVVRGLTRPALTIFLVFSLLAVYRGTTNELLEDRIVVALVYLATVAVTWWFGSRPSRSGKAQ